MESGRVMVEGGAGVELMPCPKTSTPKVRIEKRNTKTGTENLVLITGLAIWSHYPTIQLRPAIRWIGAWPGDGGRFCRSSSGMEALWRRACATQIRPLPLAAACSSALAARAQTFARSIGARPCCCCANVWGLLSPWLRDGQLESVFQVAATFPMKRLQVGVVHESLPFNIPEFNATERMPEVGQ